MPLAQVCSSMEEKLLEKVVLLGQLCSLGREGYGAVRKDRHPPSQTASEVTDVTARSLSYTWLLSVPALLCLPGPLRWAPPLYPVSASVSSSSTV